MTKLSENFTVEEFTRSATAKRLGIDNSFKYQVHFDNAVWLCENFLEPIRLDARKINKSAVIDLSSGYRSQKLNKVVNGSSTSSHLTGEAGDYSIRHLTIYEAYRVSAKALIDRKLPFDQLIFEEKKEPDGSTTRWIHLGVSRIRQRRQLLHRTVNGQYLAIKSTELKYLVEGIA